MPGTVLKLNVGKGQKVLKGETLMIVEAMKMEVFIFVYFSTKLKRLMTPWSKMYFSRKVHLLNMDKPLLSLIDY
jgi:acetyl/propionyl-CoA carboxylase alpha subunit